MSLYDGNASRFNTRFSPGAPIYAKQLNDLANGVNSAVPQPYVGAGPLISYTPGGAIITGFIDDSVVAQQACPFTITFVTEQDPGSDPPTETTYIYAQAGMVNSLIPQIGITADPTKRLDQIPRPRTQLNFNPSDGYSYIYLKVSCLENEPPDLPVFPVSDETDILYPRIVSTIVQQQSTPTSAFFLLATAYRDSETGQITLWQLSCGSQWCDRIQVNTSDVRYFFARA